MRASYIMFFEYLAMMGVPVLLMLLAISAVLFPGGIAQKVLLVPIAAGSVIYGVIGIREAFVHGGK
jgi:hypothetical protein